MTAPYPPDHRKSNPRMIKTFVTILIVPVVSATAHASAYEKYPVSPLVSEVKVGRAGDVLFRYIEFFEDYPCIRFETMQPISHKLIDRMEACTFQIDNSSIDVRRKDLAGVGYKEYRLEGNVFHFTADIVLGGSGPALPPLSCKVVIANKGKMSRPACTRGERPLESDKK